MLKYLVLIFSLPIVIYSYELPEIKVFGDRLDQKIEESFANMEVITKDKIEDISPADTYDIINYINGSNLKSYDKKHTNIDLRGFGEKGALNNIVLINGMKLNTVDMSGVDLSTIPVDAIERVEVYHGGNSVLFGDRAIGGVINIVTKKPIKGGFNFKSDFGSYDYQNYYSEGVYANENISLMLNANRSTTDGYRLNSDFDKTTIGGEASYFGQNIEYNISGSYADSDYGLPGPLSSSEIEEFGRKHSLFPDDGGNDKDGYINNRVKLYSPIGDFVINGDYRKRDRGYNVSSLNYDDELTYYSIRPEYIYQFDGELFSNKIQIGYDFEHYDVAVEEMEYNTYSELERIYHGIYLFDTFNIDKFILQTGFRSQYKRDFFESEDTKKSKWINSYLFMIAYDINKNNNIYVKFDKSFRFPTTDELMEYGGRLNTDLKPQKNYTLEGGYKLRYEKYYLNLVAFYQKSNNEIFTNPDAIFYNEGFFNTNIDTERLGVTLNVGATFKNYLIDIKYNYIDGNIDEGSYKDADIPLVSKHSLKGLFKYKSPFGVNLYYQIGYYSSYYAGNDYLNEAKKIDGYFISDIKCEYSYKNITAYVKVNNLFDEKYYDYAYYTRGDGFHYYPSYGRNWVAGASIKF